MAKDQFSKLLNWEDFRALGNADGESQDTEDEEQGEMAFNTKDAVRVYLERKGRGGKTVSIVKGLSADEDLLKELCKTLKAKCGVGGQVDNGEIIIQGDQRKRLISELNIMGFSNVKNAGA